MMFHSKIILNIFILNLMAFAVASTSYAQQAIMEIETDDTLPIAPIRYDDTVEPPKSSFSSSDGKDRWERYENGELDAKAYLELQDEYNALVSGKPEVKRKIASQRAKMLKTEGKINSANLVKKNDNKKDKKKLAVKTPDKKKSLRAPANKKKEKLPLKLPPKKIKE